MEFRIQSVYNFIFSWIKQISCHKSDYAHMGMIIISIRSLLLYFLSYLAPTCSSVLLQFFSEILFTFWSSYPFFVFAWQNLNHTSSNCPSYLKLHLNCSTLWPQMIISIHNLCPHQMWRIISWKYNGWHFSLTVHILSQLPVF